MSATLHRTARIAFERGIATTCERGGCEQTDALHVWIEDGEALAVLCSTCSQTVGEIQPRYRYVGQVQRGEADGR